MTRVFYFGRVPLLEELFNLTGSLPFTYLQGSIMGLSIMYKAEEEDLTDPASLMQPYTPTQAGTIYLPLRNLHGGVKTKYLGIDFTLTRNGIRNIKGTLLHMYEIELKAHNTHALHRCSNLFIYKNNQTLMPNDLQIILQGNSTSISRRISMELPIGDIVELRSYYYRTKFSCMYNNDPFSTNYNLNKVEILLDFVKEIN